MKQRGWKSSCTAQGWDWAAEDLWLLRHETLLGHTNGMDWNGGPCTDFRWWPGEDGWVGKG